MKIGPFEFGRKRADETIPRAAAEPTRSAAKERGASGTVNQEGFLQPDEYSRDLQFPHSIRTYERMRKSDASVRESLGHVFGPIMNATPDVEPAGDEPGDLELAAFGRMAFFEWPIDPFKQRLRQKLNFVTFGFQVFELVEQIVDAELSWEDTKTGNLVTTPSRQFVAWRRWAYRKPATIYKWHVKQGELVSIEQQVWTDNGFTNPTTDAEYLAVFVNEKEGDDFTGTSILRSAHKAWWLKELLEKIMGVAFERHGRGVDNYYVPESAKNDDAVLDRIEQMALGLRAGEFNYQVFPGPKGEATAGQGQGGFLHEIQSPSGGFPDFTGPLAYLRGEIKGNVLARFAELGHGSTGARATSSVQSEIWYDAVHSLAGYIEDVCSEALRRLIDKNYPGVKKYPRFVLRDIETRSLTEFADSVSKLTASGALLPDRSMRGAVREAADLPDEDEDAEDQVKKDVPPQLEPDPTQPDAPPPPPGKPGKPPAKQDPAQKPDAPAQ